MTRMSIAVMLGVALGASGAAFAESSGRGPGWSVLSGETVGANNTVFMGQAGWPGVAFTLLHGVSATVDVGGRLSVNGFTQEAFLGGYAPGGKLQAVFRVKFIDTGALKVGLQFAPGAFYYPNIPVCDDIDCSASNGSNTAVGLALPFQLDFGLPIGNAAMVNLGVWVPLSVGFGQSGGAVVPLLFGGGIEYFLNPHVALGLSAHAGPAFFTANNSAYMRTGLMLDAMLGAAYRF